MIKNNHPKRLLSSFFTAISAYKWEIISSLLLLCFLIAALPARAQDPQRHYLQDDRDIVWQVQVMRTPAEQARGLMFRLYLPKNSAMLFVFDPPREAAFWMRQTYIPLTMRFYDAYGRLVTFYPYAMPCHQMPCPVYPSHTPVKYVLETRTADRDTRAPYALPEVHTRLLHLAPQP